MTQSAPITAPSLALLGAGGSYTLNNSGNQIGTLAANTGSVSLADSTSLSIGAVGGTSGVVTSGALTLDVTGAVTQSAPIAATSLALLGAGGSYTLTNSGNQIGTLAADTGSVSLADPTALSIGSVGGTSGVATTGALTLDVTGAVTQSAPIAAPSLALLGAGGSYTLTNPGNKVGTLAADTGSVRLADSTTLSIGAVSGTSGVATSGALTLDVSGAVTQSASIAATSLALLGSGGSYTLTNSGNQIGTLAADTGSVRLADSTSLSIGAVGATSGVATSGALTLDVTGAVTQSAPITAPSLALLGSGGSYTLNNSGNQIGTLAANTGSVSLADSTSLSIGAVGGTSGVVTSGALTLDVTGAVTQSAPIAAPSLALLGAGGSYTLTNSGNQIGTLAADTGSVRLADSTSLSIGAVGATSGVATSGALTLDVTGAVTQSAPITAPSLALLGAGGSYTLTNSGNQIGTLAADTGSVSLADSTSLSIGAVGATSGVAATGALTLDVTGAVTQSAPIAATSLALLGAGGSYTLTNPDNQVGTLAADTGSVSLADATALSIGSVGGTGGVATSGALTLDVTGTITAPAAVAVGAFTLASGNWMQVGSPLPGFVAHDFAISGGSFLRALAGDGSAGSPYQIADVYGLQGIGSSPTLLADNYGLAADIDATGTANWNGGAGFAPIGNGAAPFTGTFNGGGNTISNLTIDLPSSSDVGLFGFVGSGGVIENVGLLGGSVAGSDTVGELIGLNAGTVRSAYATGAVDGSNGDVGGFVGQNFGTISGPAWSVAPTVCGSSYTCASGAVTVGSLGEGGGFVGQNGGTISYAFATGNVTGAAGTELSETSVGGFAGANSGQISNAFASGNVTVGDSGLAGGFGSYGSGSFTDITAFGAVNAGDNSVVGGLIGALLVRGSISNSSAQNTLVASSGANSIVGGIAGINEGAISDSTSSAPVSGVGDSLIGGLIGVNLGLVSQSSVDPTITASGGGNFIGGIAGLNVGTITDSAAQVVLVSGDASNYVGGVAGVDGAYTNETVKFANSSFPTGTTVASTATGSGFSGPVGSTAPASTPSPPSWLNNCTDPVCSILTSGALQLATQGAGPTPTSTLEIPIEVITNGANPSVASNRNPQPNDTGCKSGAIGGSGFTQLAASPTWRNLVREIASAAVLRESISTADLDGARQRLKLKVPGAENATALAQRIGSTVVVHNQVDELNGAAAKQLSVGDNVFLDEIVQSGQDSSGKFVLSDATNLAMGPKSTVKLDRFVFSGASSYSQAVINLTKGTFRFITGNSPKTAYEIDTPVASVGVRGTIVDIKVEEGVTTVALQEGHVTVCPRQKRQNHAHCVTMTPGQTVTVTLAKIALSASDWTFASACVGDSDLCGQTTVAQAAAIQQQVAMGCAP